MPKKARLRANAYGTATVLNEAKPKNKGWHKFCAVPQVVDGIRFASTKEAKRYQVLKTLQQQGYISDLKLQPKFELVVHCVYKADFEYLDELGNRIIEDVKGYKTREYKQKRKLMREQHGITIKET